MIGYAGETIFWPGSFVWAFFSHRVTLGNSLFKYEMSLLFELCHEASYELYSELLPSSLCKKQV